MSVQQVPARRRAAARRIRGWNVAGTARQRTPRANRAPDPSPTETPGIRRMGGEDSGILALELPGQPMMICWLFLLGAPDEPSGLTLAQLRAHLELRLDFLPSLRWKLVPVPGGLHHPLWIDDPQFDLASHLHSHRLNDPGDHSTLVRLYERLIAEPLDRSRPLWDVTLVNGVPDGRQALIWRFHHCLMDGLATLTTFGRIFATEDALSAMERVAFVPTPAPDRRVMTRAALREQGRSLRRLPSLVRRTRRVLRDREEHKRSAPVAAPRAPSDVPACSLNDAFRPGRSFSILDLDLNEVRLVREVAGVSYTDVALAVVAGALRDVLQRAGDLPARPLIAECPLSLEGDVTTDRQWGNRFSNVVTSLATDVADPWERLEAISTVTEVARRRLEIVGADLWEDWLDTFPPFLSRPAMRRHYGHRRDHRDVANSNVIVTSVRGPSRPWSLGGSVVEEVWGAGPPSNGVGPLVSFVSYAGRIFVGVNAVEGSLRDAEGFATAARATLAGLASEARDRLADGHAASAG